jgi:hypothetical protein
VLHVLAVENVTASPDRRGDDQRVLERQLVTLGEQCIHNKRPKGG